MVMKAAGRMELPQRPAESGGTEDQAGQGWGWAGAARAGVAFRGVYGALWADSLVPLTQPCQVRAALQVRD